MTTTVTPTTPAAPATTVTPPSTAAPRRLTAGERSLYATQGYVLIPDVIPAAELAAIDQEMDRLLAQPSVVAKSQNHPGWLLQLGLHSDLTRRFVQDERILDLVEGIVHPGVAIYSAKLATKLPHNPEVCHWHQDDAYYVRQSASQTRMSVWIPLQDAHERNGCLWVLPGSHHWGLHDHIRYDDGQCRTAIRYDEVDLSLAVPVPVRAGTAVLFSALLWHYSKGNETDHVRRAFIVSYQEATVPRGNGAQWKIVRAAR